MSRSPTKQRKQLERVTRVKERVRDVKRASLAQASRKREDAEDLAQQASLAFARAVDRLTGDEELSAGELMGRSMEIDSERRRRVEAEEQVSQRRLEEQEKSGEVARATGEMKALVRKRGELMKLERRARDRAEQMLLDEAAARIGGKR
ncbi:MAG: hypothetical protein GXP55_16420 [Deltaproteobacteria bacterium]|nr:hypothetical protein [Deltaproteobacteria bacterium]